MMKEDALYTIPAERWHRDGDYLLPKEVIMEIEDDRGGRLRLFRKLDGYGEPDSYRHCEMIRAFMGKDGGQGD